MAKPTKIRRKPGKCGFCEQQMSPDYKNPSALKQFLTDKGKILARSRSGVCLKHQRELTAAIKRARFLALVPFVSNVR